MKCFLYVMFIFLPSLVAWQLFTSTQSFFSLETISTSRGAAVNLYSKKNQPKTWLAPILSFGIGSLLFTANPHESSTLRPVAVHAVNEKSLGSKSDSSKISGISVLNGRYSDPNHPNGFREVTSSRDNDGNIVITIRGSDSDTQIDKIWTLQTVEKIPGEVIVDFSPKGGPKDLFGVYDVSLKGIKVRFYQYSLFDCLQDTDLIHLVVGWKYLEQGTIINRGLIRIFNTMWKICDLNPSLISFR